jgi:hypothetical protein
MLLLYLHIAAACIHLISCVLSVVVHVDVHSDITLPTHKYFTDPIRTETHYDTILEQNPLVWVSANEALTLFSHLIAIFYLSRDEKMRSMESLRRTVEYSFTAGILQVALVLSAASMSLYDMFFLLMINVALQMIGYLLDKKDNRPMLLTIGFLLLATEIQYVLLNSLRLEGITLDYFVVMGVFYALFYIGFGVVKIFQSDYQDELYILMSVTSKVTLSWILIGNIFVGFEELDTKTDPDFSDLDWRAIQWGVTLLSVIGLGVGIPLIVLNKPYLNKKDKIARKQRELDELNGSEYKNLRY